MIGRLRGRLVAQEPDRVLVETAGGVGYEVRIPPRVLTALPQLGEEVLLHVHTQVSQDAITLFGFLSEADRQVFRVVQGVSGIGPSIALAVVGTLEPTQLADAIAHEDITTLSKVPKLGKKTAARLCLELADKLGRLLPADFVPATGPAPVEPSMSPAAEDAQAALAALGYSAREIARAMKASDPQPDDTVQSLLRRALKILSPA